MISLRQKSLHTATGPGQLLGNYRLHSFISVRGGSGSSFNVRLSGDGVGIQSLLFGNVVQKLYITPGVRPLGYAYFSPQNLVCGIAPLFKILMRTTDTAFSYPPKLLLC